ncbi:hypothetical protein SETIT_1G061100v2 [Setaria italica]|uniref:Uncharacterized protein n=1 Tax=Setaria italica TaxID=4555 RepID=A0A368PHC6_SETIT|nr:hypothetical protein SETIT_1G061100v2 [Setaria italica]
MRLDLRRALPSPWTHAGSKCVSSSAPASTLPTAPPPRTAACRWGPGPAAPARGGLREPPRPSLAAAPVSENRREPCSPLAVAALCWRGDGGHHNDASSLRTIHFSVPCDEGSSRGDKRSKDVLGRIKQQKTAHQQIRARPVAYRV